MIDVHDYVTERLNRARLELELRRSMKPLMSVMVGCVAALLCAFWVASNVGESVYTDTRRVAFEVADARGVIGGGRQDLRFKGISAGQIDSVELRGNTAVVKARLFERFGPIYRDARAALRPNTALEDMAIDILDRGNSRAGEVGLDRPLPVAQTDVSVQVEEALQAFRPQVRASLGSLLRNLGSGLGERGDDLRRGFVQVAPLLRDAARVSAQLTRRSELTRQLVTDTGTLAEELGRREAQLRTLMETGGITLRTLQRSGPELDATLAELAPTLSALDSSFAAVRGVLPQVDGALGALRPAVERLPAALTAVRKLAERAQPVVRELREPVRRLGPLSETLPPLSADLQGAVEALRPQIPALDYVTRSASLCSAGIQGFFQWTPSVLKFYDAHGPSLRGDFAVGVDDTTIAKDPNVRALPSCAPGAPVGNAPGSGGDLGPGPEGRR